MKLWRRTTTADTTPAQHREEWWEQALFAVSLTAVVAGLAALEYKAGEQAGWGKWRSVAVPLAIDAFAVKTLIDRAAQWWDVAFALALLLAAVALSVFQPDATWTAAGLGTVLVAVLWRHEDQRRRKRITRDTVAELGELLRHAREDIAAARGELAAQRAATADMINDAVADERRRLAREVADLRRQLTSRGSEPAGEERRRLPVAVVDLDPPPVTGDVAAQVAWVARLLAAAPDTTWREVAQHLQLEPRAAQYRITEARKAGRSLHAVGGAS